MSYNKITLKGKQKCDYLYIQNTAPAQGEFTEVGDEPSEWNEYTTLFANFNDMERPLNAGDSALIGDITGYEIYRQKYDEPVSKYVGTIKNSEENVTDMIVDYSVRNSIDYTYYLYPNTESSRSGVVLSPFVTDQISINSSYWSLFIVDETEEENIYYLDKMFKFKLNLQIDDMSNNTQITITPNFTKYPTIQYGSANYWSGSLSSLCGFISANCIDYVQTPNMMDEVKSIWSDTRRKFLKDTEGNLWEVSVSAPLSISTRTIASKELKILRFPWVEVGDASEASIINNPKKPLTDWVLTETGQAVPYYTYLWDEQYKWNNSYYWTGEDDSRIIQNTNLGRKIKE